MFVYCSRYNSLESSRIHSNVKSGSFHMVLFSQYYLFRENFPRAKMKPICLYYIGLDNDPRKRGLLSHLCDFSYFVQRFIYNFLMTFAVPRAFMVGFDKQPVDTDSSQASGLAALFQGSMNVYHSTGVSSTVTLHHFLNVFYMFYKIKRIPKFICSSVKVK